MNYETAKKLKDARFPVKEISSTRMIMQTKGLIHPTLSELIEACGDEVRLQSYWSENDLMWQADNSNNFLIKENQIAGVGSTPEEAVANLWLELNKK